MATGLFTSRLRVPPLPRHTVHRTTLLQTLERSIPLHKLTLVTAPAGYGKTSLVADWATSCRDPVAWFTLDRQDNDPERFLRSLVMSWGNADPGIRQSPVYLLISGMGPDLDSVIDLFIQQGEQAASDVFFVLDEAHLIENDDLLAPIVSLLDHLPSRMHVVLIGRRAPLVPIARYRARGELVEVHADDLRFGVEETREFLAERMGLPIGEDQVSSVNDALEGWVAGLQLVSLSLRGSGTVHRSRMLSGKHRFIADYLREDVLAWLPASARDFLVRTSILTQLTAPLCDALLLRGDSQEMLEWLERENLFIEPLDEEREWYRYHPLFADVLQEELQRTNLSEIGDLHRRAATWYLAYNRPEDAFAHAVSGDDDETGVAVIDQYMGDLFNTGQLRTVKRWLDTLPPSWRHTHPGIAVADAAFLLVSGDLAGGTARLDEAESRLSAEGDDEQRRLIARVSAVRCYVSCFQKDIGHAEEYGYRALADLTEDDVAYRADIFHALGDTYRHYGQWDRARAAYLHVFDSPKPHVTPFREAHVYGALADLELMRGHLRSAEGYWRQAIDAIAQQESLGLIPVPVIGWVHLRFGEVLYERNDLAAAREHLDFGEKHAALGDDPRVQLAGATLLARLRLTEGDWEAAATYLDGARRIVERTRSAFEEWAARFEECQVAYWLARGERHRAIDWVRRYLDHTEGAAELDRSVTDLIACRVLIMEGDADSLGEAGRLLGPLLAQAVSEDRVGTQIRALGVQALIHRRRGDVGAAMTSLQEAMRLAAPEGYIRLFVDLGPSMGRLLQEARQRQVMRGYVDDLLAAFGSDTGREASDALPEPLSPRELEVLRMLAAGLTNREIAEKLYISAETVKKHTASIFGKLGVGNRTEAAARARALDLLDDR